MKIPTSLLLCVAAALLLISSGTQHSTLHHLRVDHHLSATQPLQNAPPLMAFTTVALGGFKGLIADVLWLRMSSLQEEHKYFELVQLANWVTKLEPRFTSVWAFHAWNMAYNISVMLPDPNDRWRWVKNGIHLLRDEGLRYNPGDPLLYWELGWLYQHKIGMRLDDAHITYRQQLAFEIHELFRGSTPDYESLRKDGQAKETLISTHKLDPEMMYTIDKQYGYLDWRLPETHAIYWSTLGSKQPGHKDAIRCTRMIYQSLGASFTRGHLDFDPETGAYKLSPRPELLPVVLAAYNTALKEYQGNSGLKMAHANFMHDAILVFYTLGQRNMASEIMHILNSTYPSFLNTTDLDTLAKDTHRMQTIFMELNADAPPQ